MTLYTQLQTRNDCYRASRWIKPSGITVHSTGCNNPCVRRYCDGPVDVIGKNAYGNHWNQPGTEKAVHAFIGKDARGDVCTVQTLPWNMRGWHAGQGRKGSFNDSRISFEICEDGLQGKAYFSDAYQEAVELCAYLCKEYGLDPMTQINDHHESYMLGYASNHGDVAHWFGRHGKTMDTFRAAVAHEMRKDEEVKQMYDNVSEVPAWGKATVHKLVEYGALNGNGHGLALSEEMLRVFVVLDRMGKL